MNENALARHEDAQIIHVFPPAEVSPSPNQWLQIAVVIVFAIFVGIAVQI
ncbi:hypothetical protein [Pararhizobium antarcticum]|nr:hypothetical protein [Pararhizobium antarcticum]